MHSNSPARWNPRPSPRTQVWALLLQSKYPELATDIIYVAGDRVVTDALCKPFSMGRNLFCVHSKARAWAALGAAGPGGAGPGVCRDGWALQAGAGGCHGRHSRAVRPTAL